MVGGIGGRFPNSGSMADLDEAQAPVPGQLAAGFSTICFKPSMYLDDARDLGAFWRRLVAKVEAITS